MYPRKFSQPFVSSHNLKNMRIERSCGFKSSEFALIMKQKFGCFRNEMVKKFAEKCKLYKILRGRIREFPSTSTDQTNGIWKVWAHQCECVVAQRVRRYQQMFCLYSKWWEERALKEILKNMRITFTRRGKEFMLGAVGVSAYNWDKHRIPDDEFKDHLKDLDYVYILKDNTVCNVCEQAQSNKNKSICECGTPEKLTVKTFDDWEPFVEENDLMVWRRVHSPGLFEYKVYGSYSDVTAEDFLNVQIDVRYRRKWDSTAVVLEVPESDPDPDSHSDILYWEMQWPTLFANRDYVFNRRYMIDQESKTIVIVNKITEHPAYPKYSNKFRVEEYWSCMVIKPHGDDLRKPGIEFSLTYYDNPGLNIPTTITNWVSMKVMPDYLTKLRNATRKYREYCLADGDSEACEFYRKEEKKRRAEEEKNKLDYCSYERVRDRKGSIPAVKEQDTKSINKKNSDALGTIFENSLSSELQSQSSTAVQKETSNFWKYLHPLYYFH